MGLDQQVRALEEQLERLRTISVPRAVVARASTAAGQNIANATLTIIDYGTVDIDPDSHITTGAAWKFTAKVAGYYQVHAMASLASTTTWAAGEAADIRLYKNGVFYSALDRNDEMNSAAVAQIKVLVGADLVSLAVGDYIDVRMVQSSGGALTLHPFAVQNYIAVMKVT